MGSVKISVGGTWKDAQSTTTTTQSCTACKYNCTDACHGGCADGCDGSGCTGLCKNGCKTYCTSCWGCSSGCYGNCVSCWSNATTHVDSPGVPSRPGTSPSTAVGTQYGKGTGTQTTTTTDNTGRVNVGGGFRQISTTKVNIGGTWKTVK